MGIKNRRIQLLLAILLSGGMLAIATGTAAALPAHAKVDKALPAIGSTINSAPTTVTVFTLENINPDPKLSNLFVYAPNGDLISQGNAKVSLSNPKEMSITIKPNGNGIYVVRWITVSADDGDPDQGAFVFTVNPGAAAATPTPAPKTAVTTPTTQASGGSGIPLWVPIVVGILALLVGLGGGFGLARSSNRSFIGTMRKTITEQEQEETPTRLP